MTRHPSTPRKRGLLNPAIRILQPVPHLHIHEHERIERHMKPARLQRPDRLPHALIRWRAAIVRPPVRLRHNIRPRPRHTGDRPLNRRRLLLACLHPRPDPAHAATQVIAKPPHYKVYAAHVRHLRLKLVDRRLEVRDSLNPVHVLRRLHARSRPPPHHLARQRKFPRPRDHVHRPRHILQPIRPAPAGLTISNDICGIRAPNSSTGRSSNTTYDSPR